MKKKSSSQIREITGSPEFDIALDTIRIGKQAIIFVNSKRSAESAAEKIASIIRKKTADYQIDYKHCEHSSKKILEALDSPTKQCRRLSESARYGIAFHHAGLTSSQREIIEEDFKSGKIKIIAATPTLAMGVDLPAYRVIIRDLKRYTQWGMQYIPVLEYQQQAGRAGRPSYDNYGEALCIADTETEKEEITEKYVNGEPEEILSKLAAEPILRTYILSLISSNFITNTQNLIGFFERTFYAKHYGDTKKLSQIIYRMLDLLEEWNFIEIDGENKKGEVKDGKEKKEKTEADFVSALKLAFSDKPKRLEATLLGRRVSELYLDPYTANFLIVSMERLLKSVKDSSDKSADPISAISLIQMICSCIEMRPLLRVKSREIDEITGIAQQNADALIYGIPEPFDDAYEEFLQSIKTSMLFMEWMDEKDEEYLLEKYDVRPGELNAKRENIDWIMYGCEELCKLMKMHVLVKHFAKLRFRMKYGAKEELTPLLQLKNIGRIRARALFNRGIKDIRDVKSADLTTLNQIVGKSLALDIKRQVGQELSDEKVVVKENKRKGQINLNDYS